MSGLTHSTLLSRDALEERCYLPSLLSAARSLELIDSHFLDAFCQQLRALLLRNCRAYTSGRGTSLRREIAAALSESIEFTLSLYLKRFEPLEALATLQHRSLERNYADARASLDGAIRSAELFYRMDASRPIWENDLLSATFLEGIPAFFQRYNPEYGAHETHITADYPVLFYPQGFRGIEFIQKYLECFIYENRLLRALPRESVHRWLCTYAAANRSTPRALCDNLLLIALAGAIAADEARVDSLQTAVLRLMPPSETLRQYVLRVCNEYDRDLHRIARCIRAAQ